MSKKKYQYMVWVKKILVYDLGTLYKKKYQDTILVKKKIYMYIYISGYGMG